MNENEKNITTTEVTNYEPEVVEEENGISTGLAMLIGSGLTLAAIAGVKKLKKVRENRKAKKSEIDKDKDGNVIDITDDVEEVDKK